LLRAGEGVALELFRCAQVDYEAPDGVGADEVCPQGQPVRAKEILQLGDGQPGAGDGGGLPAGGAQAEGVVFRHIGEAGAAGLIGANGFCRGKR